MRGSQNASNHLSVIPAKAGIHGPSPTFWIPAFAGKTMEGVGKTTEGLGKTMERAGLAMKGVGKTMEVE
ncbi:hypothetical protein HS121_08010 [bacterium]|nr:hypothetical protein [bacterium]